MMIRMMWITRCERAGSFYQTLFKGIPPPRDTCDVRIQDSSNIIHACRRHHKIPSAVSQQCSDCWCYEDTFINLKSNHSLADKTCDVVEWGGHFNLFLKWIRRPRPPATSVNNFCATYNEGPPTSKWHGRGSTKERHLWFSLRNDK